MSPDKKSQILTALASFGGAGATVADLAKKLQEHRSGPARCILEMRKTGEVVQVGTVSGAAVYAPSGSAVAEATMSIFDQCRQNWRGYHIHKIFGSAGRVSA
ncbi:hypothetical protein [Lelliottia nimipressuralis]|uniref:ArsR family transcriptional regulator n=1 Tax=Lelliottia nimipressuralis TaxID=69220 RepID=A0ABD4KCQ2_9ENTR|nr:hypothetical protein [Lelliottia nimipressuralis]MBF4179686.1 hypothetical protein [Lelliottia nimipressuralis]